MKNILFLVTALICAPSFLNSQNLYDEGTIQDIQITFSQSNWDQILDQAYLTGSYTMAQTVVINGTVYDSVGVKYKGNSTYSSNQTKNPFHIELDTYKDQDYQGYKDIKLSNVKNDPSFVREVLSYKIGRQYMDAPLSNYANVTVNGSLIGLYSNSEAITKTFLKDRFDSKKNTFIKCNPIAGAGPGSSDLPNLVYLGTDSTPYYPKYELKSDFGWQELINLCDTLNNTSTAIDEILDVDRALWMLAFDNVLVNLDSYIGAFAQNYYLYRDDFNKFIPIIWDMNESFGKFSMTGTSNLNSTTQKQQLDHLLHSTSATYPLVSKLLANAQYKRMYLAHIKTILLENFDNNQYFTWAQTMQTTIDAAVQADGNKFYSYADFTTNLTSDLGGGGPGPGGQSTPGITSLMNGRTSYLLGLSDFTQTEPTISNVLVSNSTPVLNDVLDFTTDVINENDVYFGYRTAPYAPFQRIIMFDDGAHNDGAAGDGKYGVSIAMSATFLQYYIYAENSGIGKFSPVRAEYEYYVIETATPPAGDLVINELLASNDFTQADQDGEFDDWIELFNNTGAAIDISGYYLSDDAMDLTLFQFPAGTSIAANGYLIVWADADLSQTGLHTDFKLSASGETLFLSDASSAIVDQITFPAQTTDVSYGRFVNGTGAYIDMSPTYSAENTNVLGLENILIKDLNVIVYPNPSNGLYNYEISEGSSSVDLVVYDLLGNKLITENNVNSGVIDLSAYSDGVYVVQMNSESVNKTIRLVKN